MIAPGERPHDGLLRNVLTYGAGDFALKLVALISLPIFTRYLGPAEYGRYVIALTIASLVQSLLLLGGDSALGRVWFASHDPAEQRIIAGTALRLGLIVLLAALTVLIPLSPAIGSIAFPNDGLAPTLAAVLLAPVAIISLLSQQVLRNRFRPIAFTALSTAQAFAFFFLGIATTHLTDWGATGLIAASIAAQAAILPLRWWLIRDCWTAPSSAQWRRRLLAYGLPLVPVSIAAWLSTQVDRLLLQHWCAPEAVGWYGTAQTIALGIQALVIGAFAQAWSPHITRLYAIDQGAAARLAGRMLPALTAGLLPIAVGLAWSAPWLVTLVSGQAYAPAATAMPALALTLLAAGIGQITALGISLSGKTLWFSLIGWGAAAIGLTCNLLLLPRYGMEAAAWISALATWITVGAQALVSRHLWRVPIHKGHMTGLLIFGFLSILSARWYSGPLPSNPLLPCLMTLAAAIPALLAVRAWHRTH